jgi:hypothetical protein
MLIQSVLPPIPQELLHSENCVIRDKFAVRAVYGERKVALWGCFREAESKHDGTCTSATSNFLQPLQPRLVQLSTHSSCSYNIYDANLDQSSTGPSHLSPRSYTFCFSSPPCLNERSSRNTTPQTSTPPKSSALAHPSKQDPKCKPSA